jgi:hypothetical protein
MYTMSMEEEGYGRGDHAAGFARDALAPGDPSLPQLDEPAGTELFDVTEREQLSALDFIDQAVSTVVAEVGDLSLDAVPAAPTPGFHGRGGGQGGLGDSRPPGPLGDGVNVIPRWERWELRYETNNLQAYARQLDYFRIELGALGGKREVDYAYELSSAKPKRRTGLPKDDKRLYMTWRGGRLREFDTELLRSAGIATEGRMLVQFYPREVEEALASLERRNAGNRSPRDFQKTIFGVRAVDSSKMEFFIVEQRFRNSS